jgi:hypothetical protein
MSLHDNLCLLTVCCSSVIGCFHAYNLTLTRVSPPNSRKLSLTSNNESWWEFSLSGGNIQSILVNSHATLVLAWPVLVVHESWENCHANSRFSTLMQLLFNRGTRVGKTFMRTLASQLSSTLMQLLFLFNRGMRVEKTLMQTLAYKLSLCNSCSCSTGASEMKKL